MSTRCVVPMRLVVDHVLLSAAYLIAVVETVLAIVMDGPMSLIVPMAFAALLALVWGSVNGVQWMTAREACACVRHDDKGAGS